MSNAMLGSGTVAGGSVNGGSDTGAYQTGHDGQIEYRKIMNPFHRQIPK